MLFNSFVFVFGFLPITLIAFYGLSRSRILSRVVLIVFSLFFYAWWNPRYLAILAVSIVFNYLVGAAIQSSYEKKDRSRTSIWLTIGVGADLAMLGWFKYTGFAVQNLDALGFHIAPPHIALPLAISFFTFQKIAYLVDSARGEVRRMSFLDFTLFAAFFPQLISGPITHYKEIVPQLRSPLFGRLIWRNIMVGLVIFGIGLFKKTVIADTFSRYSDTLYAHAGHGAHYGLVGGWLAAVTFTFQVYYDFSGYSDMAIGLARMFGVILPLNFHSPLRARNISDYWRRWHMTLQRFVVTYLFQPLTIPLTRFAVGRNLPPAVGFFVSVIVPFFVTFLAVGIWHGAGWTFVAFGVMQAIYLCVHQVWIERRQNERRRLRKLGRTLAEPRWPGIVSAHLLTLAAILFSNVMFRAVSVGDAVLIWRSMLGLDWSAIPPPLGLLDGQLIVSLILAAGIVFLMPNTQQIMSRFKPALYWSEWRRIALPLIRWQWRPTMPGIAFAAVTLFLGIMFIQRGQAVFIYFNF
jgi:alginate O-acetyltransferase complex protein AlgI